MTYRVFVVRVFENLMSRNDKLKVGSSQWPERDMFLSHMGCISLITMKQIKSYVFLAIFDQCPILTCPGMTNYHDISDLDKTCCVNCTELHSSLLTIISTFSFWNRSYVAIKSFAWSNQLFAMVSKTGAELQKDYDNNGQAVKLSKLRF